MALLANNQEMEKTVTTMVKFLSPEKILTQNGNFLHNRKEAMVNTKGNSSQATTNVGTQVFANLQGD